MHKKLSKPPLTYVLAQVKISAIENIKQYIPKLQDSIRKKFPIFDRIEIQNVEIKPSSKSYTPYTYSTRQWNFKDKKSLTGIVLDSGTINIHTSKYEGFDEFMKQVEYVLAEFNKRLDIDLFTRIGLRYINIIDSNIDKNIQKNLLGFQSETHGDQFLSKTETIQKTGNVYIKLRATHTGSNKIISNIDNKLVPPDLAANAGNLLFEHYKMPKDRYVMLDIDSFNDDLEPADFDVESIKTKIYKLHNNIYEVFSKAITSNAKKEWS
jgi:uncharacterized protein (TIGR04255 family)